MRPPIFFGLSATIGPVLNALRAFFRRLFALDGGGFLCDRCRYCFGDVCNRPERPNAKTCPDFKKR